ncbi:hypothetical protein BC629DRAFT_420728 [Irpex lacteus]|nr:hypothetical protein BC629DRAFT_420728 [Irpex lacteus]
MNLTNDKVKLQPLGSIDLSSQATTVVQAAWGELLYRSVEAISSSLAGVEDFAEECIYLGVILAKTLGEDSEETESCDVYDQWSEHTATLEFRPVGIIYLKASALPGTFDIGLAIVPEQRGHRWGSEAIRLLMGWAFEELHCHRVQARVVESNARWRSVAMGVFMGLGFSLEGTSRRAIFCPTHPLDPYPDGTNGEWRDVTHLALLDIDWVMYSVKYDSPSSLIKCRWEELFAREEKERSELIRFEEDEERRRRAKRRRTNNEAPVGPLAASNSTACRAPSYSSSLPSYSPYPPYPFSPENLSLDKGKGVDRSMIDNTFFESIEDAISHVQAHTPQPTQMMAAEWRPRSPCYVPSSPSPPRTVSPARSSPASSYAPSERGEAELISPFVSDFFDVSPASPTGTSLTFTSDSDNSLYDAESVPRSASVISDTSTHGLLSDEWDFLDSASIASDAAENMSESEQEL